MVRFISIVLMVLGLLISGCSNTDIQNPVEKEQAAITSVQEEKEAIKEIHKKIEEEINEEMVDEEMPEDLEVETQ